MPHTTTSALKTEYGISASAVQALSATKQQRPPRERVQQRSQFDPKALSGASSTGNLPEAGESRAAGKIVVAHAARPETDKHISRRGKLQKVAVNANADALIREAKEGRISVEAYWSGFVLQTLLERSHGLHSPSNREFLAPMGGNKVRGQANAVLKMIERADFLATQFRAINAIVGMTGMRILTLCLIGNGDGDGPKTFSEVAEMLGMARDWTPAAANNNDDGGIAYAKRLKNEGIKVGWAFRNSLDLLASHWEFGSAPALPRFTWGQ